MAEITSSSASMNIYHAIFKHFVDGIIGINEAGIIQAINPAAELVFGYLADEIVGKNISILMPEPYRSEHDAYLKRYCTGSVGSSRQVTGQKKDGTTFPMELAISEVIENNERMFLGSIRDLSTEKYYKTSLKEVEENLRQSQEYAGVAHWHYDVLTKQMNCSNNFKTIHGFAKNLSNRFYVETLLAYTHPDDKNLLSDSFARCLAGINRDEIEVEYRIINDNGILQWVHLKGGVEKNVEEQAIFIHGIVQDITKRKNAESRGVALGEIIDNAQIEIYIIDMATFKFVEVNELARDNLSFALDELQELTPLDINKGLEATDYYQILTPLYSGEQESVAFQSEHYRRDGSTYPVEVKFQFMAYAGQEVCVAFIEDITERLNIMKKLNDASQAKSLFLSQMSHELRTPLNAILGFSQLMEIDEETPLSIDQSENINEISKAGNHLLNLINEILDLSKIEAGKVSISFEPMDIKAMAYTVQQLVEPIAIKQGVTFINEVDETFCLLTDSTRCKQILINLISNAIKYNKKKGNVTLKIELADDNQFLRIEVEDTGIGLTEAEIEKIFVAFERLGAETTDIEGTGIGLTLTKELVVLMGGEIGVNSQVGKGSCFWFTLPLIQKEVCYACWKIKKTEHSSRLETNKRKSKIAKKDVVLYIEDNKANLKLVEKVVQKRLGYTFLAAPDIETGLAIAREHKPDIILMDLHLPGINGIDGKKLFAADVVLQHIPIVALSASAMQNDIEQAMTAGFNKFLTKPVDMQDLKETIQLFIEN